MTLDEFKWRLKRDLSMTLDGELCIDPLIKEFRNVIEAFYQHPRHINKVMLALSDDEVRKYTDVADLVYCKIAHRFYYLRKGSMA